MLLLLTMTVAAALPTGQSLSLSWDASADPNVIGYRVYYGGASGRYTNVTTVGKVTAATIPGLVAGTTYYFAVTAFDASGNESDFSNELADTVPTAGLQISALAGGLFGLASPGSSGHTYEIQASTDLVVWTIIGTQTVGAGGSFTFTDADAPNYPARFYRTRDTQP